MFARSPAACLRLFLVVLLVWTQGASLSHAAEYGDHPHEHDGVQCELTILTSEDLAILPIIPETGFSVGPDAFAPQVTASEASWKWPPERGPPPRSPPSHQQ